MSQQINLFNPVFLKQKKVFTAVAMAQALGVLVLGGLAMVAYGNQSVRGLTREVAAANEQLIQKQARQAAVNAEFAPRTASKELEAQITQSEAQLRALYSISSVLQRGDLGNTQGFSPYFVAFARQNVNGLWLTGVSIAGAGAATEIGVRGRAMEAGLVPGYLSRLTREAVMQGKTFGSLQIEQAILKAKPGEAESGEPAPFVEFSLQSVLREEGK